MMQSSWSSRARAAPAGPRSRPPSASPRRRADGAPSSARSAASRAWPRCWQWPAHAAARGRDAGRRPALDHDDRPRRGAGRVADPPAAPPTRRTACSLRGLLRLRRGGAGSARAGTITKAWELGQAHRWGPGAHGYDTVILDAPASGHGLGLLRTPRTFADIARVPIAGQARTVAEALADPARSRLVAVALPSELAVSETLELEGRVAATLGRDLDAIVVNGLWPRRLSGPDVAAVAAADGAGSRRPPGRHRCCGPRPDPARSAGPPAARGDRRGLDAPVRLR